jgi:hypothetical protein
MILGLALSVLHDLGGGILRLLQALLLQHMNDKPRGGGS